MQNWHLVACSKTISVHEASSSSSQPFQPTFLFNPHRGIVNCATFNHTNKLITSCGQDGKIYFVKAAQPDQVLLDISFNTAKEEPSSVSCCAFSSHSNYIAAGSVNKTVKIWQTQKNKQMVAKLIQTGAVSSIAWFSNEEVIASSSISGDILLHSVKTGSLLESFKTRDSINNIKLAADKKIAACTNSGSILVWDVNSTSGKPICHFSDSKKLSASTTCLSISPFQPALLAASSIDSTLSFYDINDNKLIKTIGTDQPLSSVAFHQNGHTIAVGGMNGALLLYDLRNLNGSKNSPLVLEGHDTQIKHLEFASSRDLRRDKDSSIKQIKVKENAREGLKSKTLNTGSNKIINENHEEEEKQSRVRNLARRQEYNPPQIKASQPKAPQSTRKPPSNHHHTYISSPPKMHPQENGEVLNRLKAVEVNVSGLRSEMYEQFESLHMQIIRQLQIQQKEQKKMLQQFNREREEMKREIEKLKVQNHDLKKRTF